jgi:hypothetical protein
LGRHGFAGWGSESAAHARRRDAGRGGPGEARPLPTRHNASGGSAAAIRASSPALRSERVTDPLVSGRRMVER